MQSLIIFIYSHWWSLYTVTDGLYIQSLILFIYSHWWSLYTVTDGLYIQTLYLQLWMDKYHLDIFRVIYDYRNYWNHVSISIMHHVSSLDTHRNPGTSSTSPQTSTTSSGVWRTSVKSWAHLSWSFTDLRTSEPLTWQHLQGHSELSWHLKPCVGSKHVLTSLRITQTGESVNTERRMASRGPNVGSTSPSAIPFWNVPGTHEDQ